MTPDIDTCAIQSVSGWYNGDETVLDTVSTQSKGDLLHDYTYLDHAIFCSK